MLALVVVAAAVLHITDEAHVVQMRFVGMRGGSVDCERRGEVYACGDKSVPARAVEGLRDTLVASEKHQAFDPEALGITPEWVRSVRPQLIEQARREWNGSTGGQEDPWPNDVLNTEAERVVSFEAAPLTSNRSSRADLVPTTSPGPRSSCASMVHRALKCPVRTCTRE